MADIVSDGTVKVALVDTIASASYVPSSSEIAAGTVATTYITAMEGFGGDTQPVDASHISSTSYLAKDGRVQYGNPLILRCKKQSGTDSFHDAYDTKGTSTHVVVRRHVDHTTDFATSDVVDVYPVWTGQIKYMDPEENSMDRYEIPLFIRAEPVFNVSVT